MIGHEGEGVAREHYDRFDFSVYQAPEVPGRGETPMDLLARLCAESVNTPHTVGRGSQTPPTAP